MFPAGKKADSPSDPAVVIERFARLTHLLMQMAYQSQRAGFHGDNNQKPAKLFHFGTLQEARSQIGTPYDPFRQICLNFLSNFVPAAKLQLTAVKFTWTP
jgi:hypothetical protein